MIQVNGQAVEMEQGLSVQDYLCRKNYQVNRIAVELNGVILPKRDYPVTRLNDGDQVEIVNFVGGG